MFGDISRASSVINGLCVEITASPSVFGPPAVQSETASTVLTNPTELPGFDTLQNFVQCAFTCGSPDGVIRLWVGLLASYVFWYSSLGSGISAIG
jgi:hypothetical protein